MTGIREELATEVVDVALYHVSKAQFAPGQILKPGNFRRSARPFRRGGLEPVPWVNLGWESCLEIARQKFAPQPRCESDQVSECELAHLWPLLITVFSRRFIGGMLGKEERDESLCQLFRP